MAKATAHPDRRLISSRVTLLVSRLSPTRRILKSIRFCTASRGSLSLLCRLRRDQQARGLRPFVREAADCENRG